MEGPAERRPRLGLLSAITAVVVWGTSSVLIKEIDDLNGVAITAYRLWIGGGLTLVLFHLSGGRLSKRLLRLSFLGALAYVADMLLFFSAVQHTSVANATIIGALQPLLLLLIAGPLFGERPIVSDVLWGSIAVLGAGIVVFGGDAGGANGTDGDLLAVGALLAWTAYFAWSKTARQELTSLEYLTGLSTWAMFLVIPVPFLFGLTLGSPNTEAWFLITVIAIVNGALGHFLMNWSHGHVPLVAISLLTLGIPVVSAATAALFIDEPLELLQVGGMAVVLAALAVVSVHTARRTPRTAEATVQATALAPEP